MAMTAARCAECQAIIDAEQAAGRVYSAWQQADTPWHVSFIGPPETRRATGLTVHDAIQALGATFQAAVIDTPKPALHQPASQSGVSTKRLTSQGRTNPRRTGP